MLFFLLVYGYPRDLHVLTHSVPTRRSSDRQTGTGKTAGFVLPILHLLMQQNPALKKPGRPRCLILTPTRELTAQVAESVQTYGKHTPIDRKSTRLNSSP